jgi:hypothetical protein
LKPGNSGGGKDPDFWYAFEEGKVKVIGDEDAFHVAALEPP